MYSYRVGREEEGMISNRPELVVLQVKAHRGDPLNEEVDIRAEMG